MTRVPHSSHWGRFDALVDGGVLTGIEPYTDDPDPSPLVHGVPEGLTSDVRVKKPAVRRSWLLARQAEKRAGGEPGAGEVPDPRPDLRGNEPFVEVSWEEALDLVA